MANISDTIHGNEKGNLAQNLALWLALNVALMSLFNWLDFMSPATQGTRPRQACDERGWFLDCNPPPSCIGTKEG